MTPTELHQRSCDLFVQARQLPACQIPAWLRVQAGNDDRLTEAVWRLIQHDPGESEFLNRPLQTPLLQLPREDVEIHIVPDAIGAYRVRSRIGEGGHGVVYLAEQAAPRRQVAIKVLRGVSHVDVPEAVRRLDREREIIAALDHPGIAKVYDAGTTEAGFPFVVLEHVSGIRITDAADAASMSIHQRVRLFIDVCDAVQHAHDRGIIHRDITPSNILVPRDSAEATPRAKIIDFSIAKVMSGFGGQTGVPHTLEGSPIGTPSYMSPEQARGDTVVSVQTDVYSLGAVLYEVLVGVPPFEGGDRIAFMNAVRDPDRAVPMLSSKVRLLGDRAETVARLRGTNECGLRRLLQGELSWITAKALEKDPGRRYQSAAAFADDLRAYLARDRPVKAASASVWYRGRKLARRNRRLLLTAAAVAAPLLGMAGYFFWYAAHEFERTVRVANNGVAAFERYARESYDAGGPDNLERAAKLYEAAYTMMSDLGEPSTPSATDILNNWAETRFKAGGRDPASIDLYRRAWEAKKKLDGEQDGITRWRLWCLADALVDAGLFSDAAESYQELLRLFGTSPPKVETLRNVLERFAGVLDALGRHDEAAKARARAAGA
ncbi:MAG: serine/threonine protein kinase [Pyrinomonadaceae bacterium]|nr:serine/threonine protein kinase [Phycisphaerales bacterium]